MHIESNVFDMYDCVAASLNVVTYGLALCGDNEMNNTIKYLNKKWSVYETDTDNITWKPC